MADDLNNLWDNAKPLEVKNPIAPKEDLDSLWEAAKEKKFGLGEGDLSLSESFAQDKESFTSPLPMVEDMKGQSIGGMALPIAASLSNPATGIPALVGLAAAGGAGGEAWEQVYNFFVKPEKVPETTGEGVKKILQAGGEEAAYEIGGNVVGGVLGKMYHIARPKIAGGIENLQKTFEKYGGSFTAAERTESFLTETVDSLVRGSLSGRGVMKAADDINNVALKKWQDDLSTNIAKTATKNMDDVAYHDLLKNTLSKGKAGFKVSTGELYAGFDDLVVTKINKEMVENKVVSKILDSSGKPITKKVVDEITKEIRPVDVRFLKDEAFKLSERLKRISNFGKSDFGGKAIDDILSLDDALRFSDAQNLRSTMLDITRGLKNKPEEAKLKGAISKFSAHLTDAMDKAAHAQGDDIYKAYKEIKDVTEKGFESFNDKLVVKLLDDETGASRIGEMIYRDGNINEIRSLKRAIHRAARYDKSVKPGEVWEQVQQKYLESYLNAVTKDIEMTAGESLVKFQQKAGVSDAAKLSKKLQNSKAKNTMETMLNPEHRELIMEYAQASGITQAKNAAGLSMLMQLTQGGALVGSLSGRPGAARMAASVTIPTRVLAKMMTNPKTVKLMIAASKTPMSAKQAPKVITKLMIAYENAKNENEGRSTVADDVVDYAQESYNAL